MYVHVFEHEQCSGHEQIGQTFFHLFLQAGNKKKNGKAVF